MAGFQPWWPETADLGWWRMQFEWPPAGNAAGMEWLMQLWTAPLTMFSASMQAWAPTFEVSVTAPAPASSAKPVQAEVVERVVVSVPMPAGAPPVSVELMEVKLMPPEPAPTPDIEPVAEPVAAEAADVIEVEAVPVQEPVPTPAPAALEPVQELVQEPTPEDTAPAPAGGPLSINTATEEELIALKGIGPALAKLIIEKRPYATVEALVDLKGIGPKLLEQLRDQLTV